MSSSWGEPWSNNINAPQIPSVWYNAEKALFCRILIDAVSYGIVTVLFLHCIGTLLNPVNGMKWSVKWALVGHTTAMFALLTMPTAIELALESHSYIDNREFPGNDAYPPGPYGSPWPITLTIAHDLGFPLSQWLADGLLLYRCHVIYSLNFRATGIPFLMYITTIAIGITYIYEHFKPESSATGLNILGFNLETSYISVCLLLNVTIMAMIIMRLVLHHRAMRKAVGSSAPTSGLYLTIVSMLIESFSLYTISLLLYVSTWAPDNIASVPFGSILAQAQVIAPYLITLRVANRRAVTSEEISSANVGSIRFRSHGQSTNNEEMVPDGMPTSKVGVYGEPPGGNSFWAEDHSVIEEVPL